MSLRQFWLALAVCAVLAAATVSGDEPSRLRRVAGTGDPAPGGGVFDRFGTESMPIVAPVNARGDVAFFSTLGRAGTDEGFFLWSRGRVTAVAREGDRVPGAGRLSGFGKHPAPGLGDDGTVVFASAIAEGRAVEGIFAAQNGRVRAVALSGTGAPGIASGVLASLDAPAINAKGDIAFLATVRRGRETVEALLLSTRGRLQKIVAQGDAAPAGGTFAAFGPPTLNRQGAVAFAAAVEGRAVPGGIFVVERRTDSYGARRGERHAHRWNLREVLGADRASTTRARSPFTASSRPRRSPPRSLPWRMDAHGHSAAGRSGPGRRASSRTSDCGPR